jgi:hypothetical protein
LFLAIAEILTPGYFYSNKRKDKKKYLQGGDHPSPHLVSSHPNNRKKNEKLLEKSDNSKVFLS